MDAEKAAEELRIIRQIMERPVRYSTQSGLSGILAGTAALVGLALDWKFWRRHDEITAMWANMAVWIGVFVVALAGATLLTRLRERARGVRFWSNLRRRVLLTILPPFVAGAGLTAAIMYGWYCGVGPNQWGLIPAVWMLFYGVALWQVGEFSVREVRVLGAAFILAGLAAGAFCQAIPYLTLGVTFGGFHLCYGAVVWLRHGG